MNNLDIVSLSKDNKNENISQDNRIKIILDTYEKYSLKLLIRAIISKTTIPNNKKKK